MRPGSFITLLLFAIFLPATLIWLAEQNTVNEVLEAEAKLVHFRHAVGLFLAIAAALPLLLRALNGDPPGKTLALILAFLAGVLLIEPNWGVALGFAAVTLGVALRAWLPAPHRRMPTTPPSHESQPL